MRLPRLLLFVFILLLIIGIGTTAYLYLYPTQAPFSAQWPEGKAWKRIKTLQSQYPELVTGVSVYVSLKGEVKASSEKELIISSSGKDYALSYDEVKTSITVFDSSKKIFGKTPRIKKEDLKPKDLVQIDIAINPDSGKFESYAIVRLSQ